MFKMFRIDGWMVENGTRVPATIYVNPNAVGSVVRLKDSSVVKIVVSGHEYYTDVVADAILSGLNDVSRLNKRILMMN